MSNHDLGDKYEYICRQILLKRWPNSKIIETKRNSIHGIDFAIEIPNQGIMIIEVKPPTGSAHGKQMTLDWIKSNITDTFKNVLQRGYEKGYYLGAATYRVVPITLGEGGESFTLKIASKTRELNWNDILDPYNTSHENSLKICENIYHQTGESTMSLERYDRILAGLHTAADNVRLNINQLESSLAHYEQQINAMQSAGLLEDYAVHLRKHQGLEMRIKKLQEFLEELLRKLKEIEQRISALKAEAERGSA